MSLHLSERQNAAATAAITILSACVIVALIGGLLLLVGMFFSTFSGVFLPVAVAGVLALVVRPYYDWWTVQLRLPVALGVTLVFLSIILPVALFVWFFGSILLRQFLELIEKFPEWWQSVRLFAESRLPVLVESWDRYGLGESLREAVEERREELVTSLQFFGGKALSAGAGVLRGVGTFLGWVVLPVYFAFFLIIRTPVRLADDMLPFLKPETRRDVVYLAQEFVGIIVSFFRGQLIIAALQGVLLALGFFLVGLRYGMLLGIVLGFLNVVPYLGSMVGLGICLPLAVFQSEGSLLRASGVLIVFVIVQLIEGYLLTPRIMGERTGLHPMVIMVAVLFWGSALGPISGMILAIPLTAFLVVFWRLARERYIRELV